MNTLPAWMSERAVPAGFTVTHVRRNPARRALDAFARLLAELSGNQRTSTRPGLLQGVDARAKVLGLIGMVVVTTLTHNPVALVFGLVVTLALAAASRVSLCRLAGSWFAAALFTGVVALPALLNIVTPGKPILTLWHTGDLWGLPDALSVTDAGLFVAGRFALRLLVCLSFATLLTATSQPARLFRGLRLLGMPAIFVLLLATMERYLGVVARAAEEIHLAKISRTPVPGETRREQAWVAAGMGALFRRTQTLGNTVYLAMLSRGFTGEARLLDEPRWRRRDWLFLSFMLLCGVVMLMIG